MTSITVRSAFAALALVLVASPALAQTPPMNGAADHGPDHQRMHEMMQKRHEAMAHDLHTILNIRPDQEAAFAAFQASMTRSRGEDRQKGDRAAMMAMTTPQKLDRKLAKMTQHMERMRAHIEAVKSFYAALSPEQQRVFDALQRMHGGGGGHGWRGGHGMHGGPMHGAGEGPPPPPGQ